MSYVQLLDNCCGSSAICQVAMQLVLQLLTLTLVFEHHSNLCSRQ
jgi:hypothetical protein